MAHHPVDELFDHDYDGIQEFDNDLPPWWLNLFYLTIIWSVLYLLYYHVTGIGLLQAEKYNKEVDPQWTRRADPNYQPPFWAAYSFHSPYEGSRKDVTPRMMAENPGLFGEAALIEEETIEYEPLFDAANLAAGRELFERNCGATCHANDGGGNIGPNLTDNFWIHSEGDINGIIRTIERGVPAKGMIAWKRILKPEEIHQIGSYVLTLRGTTPANPKPPQGEEYPLPPSLREDTGTGDEVPTEENTTPAEAEESNQS